MTIKVQFGPLKIYKLDQNQEFLSFYINFLNLYQPRKYSVVDDWVMIIIERSGPCEKDRSAGDAGYHGPVGGWFWRILDHQLDRA